MQRKFLWELCQAWPVGKTLEVSRWNKEALVSLQAVGYSDAGHLTLSQKRALGTNQWMSLPALSSTQSTTLLWAWLAAALARAVASSSAYLFPSHAHSRAEPLCCKKDGTRRSLDQFQRTSLIFCVNNSAKNRHWFLKQHDVSRT